MTIKKKRKEVALALETIAMLEEQAKIEGRTLKNFMEYILSQKANAIEIQEEAKALEIRRALIISRAQSAKGEVKSHEEIINAAKLRVDANSVDKAS